MWRQNFFGMMKKRLAGLRQRHLFAHPVKKPTANIGFERLHGMADGGLGEKELFRRDGKAAEDDDDHVRTGHGLLLSTIDHVPKERPLSGSVAQRMGC